MSRDTEKMFKELHKYIEEHSDENRTEADVQRLMNEFIEEYNGNIIADASEKKPETSDDYLEMAYKAYSDKEALKYARQALKLDPNNFDAEVMVIDNKSKDSTSMVKNYANAVRQATEHMKAEGFFDEENIGAFWGIIETRPYMRLRIRYVRELLNCGMIGQAKDEIEEMLYLCEGDNVGSRYYLMHIYVYFEDEQAALDLHKKFDCYDETEMLLPLSMLYYKKGKFTTASKYLRRLNAANKDLKRFLKMYVYMEDDFDGFEMDGAYRPGTIEEFMVEMRDNAFLFIGMESYMEWAWKEVKKF